MTWTAVPTNLLKNPDTSHMLRWLSRRGYSMSLAELDAERRRRGIVQPPKVYAKQRGA